MHVRFTLRAIVVISILVAVGSVAATKAGEPSPNVPTWTSDARWYRIDVDRFRNGDPSNDPKGVTPWSSHVLDPGETSDQLGGLRFGGDLAGIQSKLPYLKRLGVNALWLSRILTDDLLHVDDSFGVKGSLGKLASTTKGQTPPTFSESDRVLLRLIEEAHKEGFRVVLDLAPVGDPTNVLRAAKRWMDPNGDGQPVDGIDGWVMRVDGKTDRALVKRLQSEVKKVNPEAILISHPEIDFESAHADCFDTVASSRGRNAICAFFQRLDQPGASTILLDQLQRSAEGHELNTSVPMLSIVSGPDLGRLLSGVVPHSFRAHHNTPDDAQQRIEDVRDFWRLATVVHYAFLGSPVTYYGDEVGLEGSRLPMWWEDVEGPPIKKTLFRKDFYELIRLLNIRRELHAPLRDGRFEKVFVDEKRQLFAFARVLQSERVVLVVNYGNKKHRVKVPADWPGQLVGIIAPQLRPAEGSSRLRLGGSRQRADQWAEVTFWINPMSVRIVIINETEGR